MPKPVKAEPAELVALSETLAATAVRLELAAKEASAARVQLEEALAPFVSTEIEVLTGGSWPIKRDAKRMASDFDYLLGHAESIVHESRHVAGQLGKAKVAKR